MPSDIKLEVDKLQIEKSALQTQDSSLENEINERNFTKENLEETQVQLKQEIALEKQNLEGLLEKKITAQNNISDIEKEITNARAELKSLEAAEQKLQTIEQDLNDNKISTEQANDSFNQTVGTLPEDVQNSIGNIVKENAQKFLNWAGETYDAATDKLSSAWTSFQGTVSDITGMGMQGTPSPQTTFAAAANDPKYDTSGTEVNNPAHNNVVNTSAPQMVSNF